MREITEQMLRDRFAIGFFWGGLFTVFISVASIGFYIYFTQKPNQP